jgi:hypothetical protein
MCMLIEIKAIQNQKFVSLLRIKNKRVQFAKYYFKKLMIKVWETIFFK